MKIKILKEFSESPMPAFEITADIPAGFHQAWRLHVNTASCPAQPTGQYHCYTDGRWAPVFGISSIDWVITLELASWGIDLFLLYMLFSNCCGHFCKGYSWLSQNSLEVWKSEIIHNLATQETESSHLIFFFVVVCSTIHALFNSILVKTL